MKFGTAPKLSLEDNAISKVYYTDKLKTHGLLDSKKISEFTNRILKEFLVKYDNSKQSIAELSGGNVQKVVVGREFDYEPDLLIMNQPTRGIDVGAIEFIRKKIVDMRSRKKAILLVSADLSEILSLSDTILVMHEGRHRRTYLRCEEYVRERARSLYAGCKRRFQGADRRCLL